MSKINWIEKLKWNEEHIDDLRYTGYAYIRQGKYDIALPFFEALAILDPESVYDIQTLGAIHLQLNQPEKALALFDRALMFEGDHSATLLNVMKTFTMMGKVEEAVKLAKILKNDPNPAIANVAKALILAYS